MTHPPRRETALDDTLADTTAASPRPDRTYQVLADRYEILGLLGAGGMGAVYRARDRELDEVVALKTLRSELVRPDMLERFRREVKLARKVTHTNVARVFDIGEHEGERFFTMELVEGESLGAILRRTGPLSVRRAAAIGTALCDALGAAHGAGIVHGDLKPDNVMMASDERVVITDFGIAASIGAASNKSGMVMGTPTYMAPEQVDRRHPIDHRADIYALGALLFEATTGQRPWHGETALATAVARLLAPPPDPRGVRPELPAWFAETILRSMAREPTERFADVAEVRERLCGATVLVSAAPPPPPAPTHAPHAWQVPPRRRLAVLPLADRSGDLPHLAFGLGEDLVDGLSMAEGLRVTSHAAARHLAETIQDARRLGRELDVQVVIEGTVQRTDAGPLALFLRAINVSDGIQLWAQRFTGDESELLAMSDAACAAIADALAIDAPTRGRQLEDPVAIDLYLKARAHLRGLWGITLEEAANYLERALERVPNDPVLLSSYATCLSRMFFYSGAHETEARRAAERAIQEAPYLGESHLALASVDFQAVRFEEAAASIVRALERAPSLADAHLLRGRLLAECGPLDDATAAFQLAYELDRGHWVALIELARLAALCGRWDDVDAHIETLGRVAPTGRGEVSRLIVRARLAMWHGEAGPLEDARRAIDERLSNAGERIGPFMVAFRVAECMHHRRNLDVDALKREVAGVGGSLRRHAFFEQLGAELAAYLGDIDAAFAHIEAATRHRLMDVLWLDGCPVFAPLRSDPRWPPLRATAEFVALPIRRALGAG